ncbi:cation:proton antiporter [Candidatus Woesearchaeota archaeon]|nr:cation:proton antiporter [Candidatus Woesearchaeota archaeon]
MNPLLIILICLSSMYILTELLRRTGIPRVVSQILAGMIFSLPFIREQLFTQQSLWLISIFAEIGVVLLLFFVGLQIDFKQFGKNLPTSLWISVLNTLLPLTLGFLASHYLFGLPKYGSLIVGICMSVSASALSLDLLAEFNKLRTKLAALIVSAGTFDDIVEMFLLAGVFTVLESAVKHITIVELTINVFLFAALVFTFRYWLIPKIIKQIEHQPEHAQLFTGAIIITLLMAVLADHLGISAMIGALFSGVIIRQIMKEPGHKPWERQEITHSIHTIAFGLFVPFFFFAIGIQTDLLSIWNNLLFSTVITILAIIGTVFGSSIGYYITNRNWKEGSIVGWAMNAKGDTELIVAQLALSVGAITHDVFSSLIFMAVISTLISPFVLKHYLKLL